MPSTYWWGAERVCADVANGLSRLGHKVAIMMDTSIAIVYPVLPDVQIYSCPERKGNSWIMYRIKYLEDIGSFKEI